MNVQQKPVRANRTWFMAGLLGTLGVAVAGSLYVLYLQYNSLGTNAFLRPIGQVYAIVSERFVDEVDPEVLQNAAIAGMVDALGDPYTFYIPPAQTDEFEKTIMGAYVGIGAAINIEEGWLTIVTPLDGSPAIAAGVRAGDRVTEIDGESTQGLNSDECADRLMGEAGTKVDLTIERKGTRLNITITRAKITTQTVRGFHRGSDDEWQHFIDDENGIAYIRVSQFNPTTVDEFDAALKAIGADHTGTVGGLIIDMRGNPGGLMGASVAMAERFLAEGTIVSSRGRSFESETALAHAAGTLPEFPMVVLIDGQSASASEIFAGALGDHDRAKLLGQRSFGKASIQQVFTLTRNGAELKVTEGRYELPSGNSPHREEDSTEWGVDPSPGFYVPMDGEEWLAAMMTQQEQEVILNGDGPVGDEPGVGEAVDWSNSDEALAALGDRQLDAAVEALQLRITGGAWQAVGEDPPSGEEIATEEMAALTSRREMLMRDLTSLEHQIADLRKTGAEAAEPEDLWPDAELTGGRVEVFDASGEQVALLDITGENLEAWLSVSDVEVRGEGGDGGEGRGESGNGGDGGGDGGVE